MRVEFCCSRFGDAYENFNIGYEDGWQIGTSILGDIVIDGIDFCPFCGTALPEEDAEESDDE